MVTDLLSDISLKNDHLGILVPDSVNKQSFIIEMLSGRLLKGLENYSKLSGMVLSENAIENEIRLEERFDQIRVDINTNRKLRSLSSGERKKIFLEFCISKKPDFLIIDNPFDHLDFKSRNLLEIRLEKLSQKIPLLQLVSRESDLLPFIQNIKRINQKGHLLDPDKNLVHRTTRRIHVPLDDSNPLEQEDLVEFKGVSVSYGNNKILDNIQWTIKKGEFWQLTGPNGSGKSTILNLITGDNPKGYGQELFIFGIKKGSGESVWQIKKKIGYFSPAMLEMFQRKTNVSEMILSGFFDSVGLYQKPTRLQQKLANQYLSMMGMEEMKDRSFHSLSVGQQRVVLILRAVVKRPHLLILDEPTEGMDDQNVQRVIQLLNILISRDNLTTLLVSHRKEPGLLPISIFELIPGKNGSIGKIKSF